MNPKPCPGVGLGFIPSKTRFFGWCIGGLSGPAPTTGHESMDDKVVRKQSSVGFELPS
jgi:hypothetical protein